MAEFICVVSCDLEEFQKEVSNKLMAGWKLHGTTSTVLAVEPIESGTYRYSQAMVFDGSKMIALDSESGDDLSRLEKVLSETVATIYFADSADYIRALRKITQTINPLALELLDSDGEKAFKRYCPHDD